MTITIRPATLTDVNTLSALLFHDAEERCASNAALWTLDPTAQNKLEATITTALQAEAPPFRQQWLVAEHNGVLVGATHSILLPVPPIYAGEFGPPGLIMEDCYVTTDAPSGTRDALLDAAETDLVNAGAQILLVSSVPSGAWETTFSRHGYQPLTLYFAKSGLDTPQDVTNVRPAQADDVPKIVTSSAQHRQILQDLHALFWKPHSDANSRFGSWMTRSLGLNDRDMFVAETGTSFTGYAISHPATPLHFPTPHDISGIGVIDDFYHEAFKDPVTLTEDANIARSLFTAAEAARQQRGDHSVLVVCPADWQSKINLLQSLGYANAITWSIKMVA